MKARVKNMNDKITLLEKAEIMRINKVWMIALYNHLHFSGNGISNVYAEACKIAGELYEDPELWYRVDEKIKEWKLDEFLPPENLDEREKVAAEIHKAHGKKWRQY